MKVLVVLENHFIKDKNNIIWCDRVVDYNFLQRYLNVFDEVIVSGRCQRTTDIVKNKLLVSGENIEFVELPDFKGIKGLIINLLEIKKILRGVISQVDCIIYRAPTHLSLFTYKEVLKQKKPLALEFMMAADKMVEGNNLINKIIKMITQNMCMKVNGVAYVTEEILQKDYPCRAIKYGENKKYFTGSYSTIDLIDEDFFDQKWNCKKVPQKIQIIHTGYMDSYRKGQHTLIKAIKIVKEKGYNIKLTLIGDGQKRSEFENMVRELGIDEIVEFKGLIKNKKEVLEYLRKSHLLVFPTQSEGLPRTIIEAMAQGLPCLSSPVDGIPELLDEEFLIDYNDVEGYANKIIELINNWDKMVMISKENYIKSKKYNRNILNSKRCEFYKKLKGLSENDF